ncbi:MAG: hypothetical protein J6A98_02610 [Clostridia bacterium]|nr:hypothetical protein [Clostridia bacterium]
MKVYEVFHKNKILMGDFERDETARIYNFKKFKHLWLKKGNEKWYFKTRLPNKELYIGDVVAPYIFERVGLKPEDYLMYYLVEMETPEGVKAGVLSKNYIGKHEFQLSYYDIALFCYCLDNGIEYDDIKDERVMGKGSSPLKDFERTFRENPGEYMISLEDMLYNIQRFCEHCNFQVDLNDIAFKLKRELLTDFFLCQVDRHQENTEFKIKHGKLTMCPIFDHEKCLAIGLLGTMYNLEKFPIYTGFSAVGARENAFEDEAAKIAKFNIPNAQKFAQDLLENADFIHKSRLLKNDGLMAIDIIAECMKDERLAALAYNFLALDIHKTLDDFEKEYMQISQFVKTCMCDQFEVMQEKFYRTFRGVEKHFSRKNNASFQKLQARFKQPLLEIEEKIKKREDALYAHKQKTSDLDEEYLLGLLQC